MKMDQNILLLLTDIYNFILKFQFMKNDQINCKKEEMNFLCSTKMKFKNPILKILSFLFEKNKHKIFPYPHQTMHVILKMLIVF